MSSDNFKKFAGMFRDNFIRLSSDNAELFRVDISGDALWELYISSFPEGTNPIFRVRTEHDGSMDRSVIRKIGNVVAIVDGELKSVWDFGTDSVPAPYNVVAEKLKGAVEQSKIVDFFLTDYENVGLESNVERLENGDTIRWHHLNAPIPLRFYKPGQVDALCGRFLTVVDVFKRGLQTITPESLRTVLELIDNDSLYRGKEFRDAVAGFLIMQSKYDGRANFIWENYNNRYAGFRNTVIGTLAVDLSEGVDIETAVRSFEGKVAPTNYRRSKSVITQDMVKAAMRTIDELGLEPALSRRVARASDVTVNNVLWADGSVKPVMKSGVESILMAATKDRVNIDGLQQVSVDDFLKNVVPEAVGVEVLMKPEFVGNLMTLTAPVHDNVEQLFRWGNNFGWSYNGGITDSIRERVKAAGGNVDAEFRVSLSWFNLDDLDLHCLYNQQHHIHYAAKCGILDVDMNAQVGRTREPVENMAFTASARFDVARFFVHQFASRETEDTGFEVEVQDGQVLRQFAYNHPVRQGERIDLFDVVRENGVRKIASINQKLVEGGRAVDIWGVTTNKYVPVKMLMNSPNHWDGEKTGNHHLFFILDGCKNDQPVRGMFNEFLKPELDPHRKVFEILGDRMKCSPDDDQLSGVGFSSTIRKSVPVRVTTADSVRQYIINF